MKQNSILLKNVSFKNDIVNVLIEGNKFASLNAPCDSEAAEVVDCSGKALIPAFYNAHTHAAMTLLRGYADDLPLYEWLTDYIWPYEATLTPQDITQGSYLAVLEMIKSGTVFFNDMYWNIEQTVDVAAKMGIRAAIGLTMMDRLPKEAIEANFRFIENWEDPTGGRIQLAVAPHAVYTVGRDLFVRCADVARQKGLKLHFHIAETEQEVKDCVAANGTTPVRLLKQWGVLGDNCIAAHTLFVDDDEIKILADEGVTVVHNPCSNMKLNSGIFKSLPMQNAGVRIALGTDGSSSNDSLSMLEEMKFAALLAKLNYGPDKISKNQVMQWATVNAARAFGLDAGEIKDGKLADGVLVDLDDVSMLPCHHLVSNLVYSADSRCIDSVICDGKFVMRGGHVPGEQEIIASFKKHFLSRK